MGIDLGLTLGTWKSYHMYNIHIKICFIYKGQMSYQVSSGKWSKNIHICTQCLHVSYKFTKWGLDSNITDWSMLAYSFFTFSLFLQNTLLVDPFLDKLLWEIVWEHATSLTIMPCDLYFINWNCFIWSISSPKSTRECNLWWLQTTLMLKGF